MSILYTLLYTHTDAPDTNLLPPADTYDITNPDNVGSSSSRVVFAPNPPNWTATKSNTDEIGGITLTINTVIQQGFFLASFGTLFSSPVSYSSSGGNIMADGVLLLSGMGGVREISPTNDLVYVLNTLSVGADTFNIDNYVLVTSTRQLYRFSGMKSVRDASGGMLFINDTTRTAVYSMSAVVTQLIRNSATTVPPPTVPPPTVPPPPLSYNLEVVGSNVQINFGSAGAYRITGSMFVTDNTAGTIVFTGNSIGSAAGITPGIHRFFQVQEATATSTNARVLVPANEYTDLFANTGADQGLAVNNPRILSNIRAVMSFTGTIGQFTVTSTGVTFNGVSVIQLMQGSTQTVTLAAGDQLSYMNGALTVTSGGNQVFNRSGVQRVTVQQGTGAAINDGSVAAAISGPGTLFFEGNMAFFTNDANIVMIISNQVGTMTPSTQPTSQPITQPTTQPTMPTPMPPNITITTASGISTLNFDGNGVVTLDSEGRRQITSGQRIQYQNKNLVIKRQLLLLVVCQRL